jgi:rubrerythrin
MLTHKEIIGIIDHCLLNSGDNSALHYYGKYKELISHSSLNAEKKEELDKVLSSLILDSIRHLAILRELRKTLSVMEEKHTKGDLIDLLNNILEIENSTLYQYEQYLNKLTDKKIVTIFTQFRDEEIQHVGRIQELITSWDRS